MLTDFAEIWWLVCNLMSQGWRRISLKSDVVCQSYGNVYIVIRIHITLLMLYTNVICQNCTASRWEMWLSLRNILRKLILWLVQLFLKFSIDFVVIFSYYVPDNLYLFATFCWSIHANIFVDTSVLSLLSLCNGYCGVKFCSKYVMWSRVWHENAVVCIQYFTPYFFQVHWIPAQAAISGKKFYTAASDCTKLDCFNAVGCASGRASGL